MPTDDTLPDKISEYLAEAFHGLLSAEGPKTLESFEDEALALAARAYGMALDRRDLELRAALPEGARAHDRRLRALATGLGDVEFRATRCLDRLGLPARDVRRAGHERHPAQGLLQAQLRGDIRVR